MKPEIRLPAPDASASRPMSLSLLASSMLAVTALAGCGSSGNQPQVAGWTLVDPAQRHPIIVSQQPEMLPINVTRGSQGLAPQQRAALLAFADKSRASDAGNSRLIISVPSGSGNEVAAMHAVTDIRRLLSDRGFQESSVQVEAYSDDTSKEPPIKVSYLRYIAEAPTCGNWSQNLAYEPNNLPYPNLGCADQRNLAAMVANPADLLGPRTEGDRSSERRDVVFDKYVKGETSNTKKSEDEKIDTQNSN